MEWEETPSTWGSVAGRSGEKQATWIWRSPFPTADSNDNVSGTFRATKDGPAPSLLSEKKCRVLNSRKCMGNSYHTWANNNLQYDVPTVVGST